MNFNLHYFYWNIILVCLLIFGHVYLFIFLSVFLLQYKINYDSISVYEYDFIDIDFENSRFAEFDVDDEYLYTLMYQEFYVLANCKFQFEIYGGNTTLDHIDFLNFIIYNINDNRNYKYIYDSLMYYKDYANNDSNIHFILLSLKNNYIYNNSNIKYINKIKHIEYWEDIKTEDLNNNNLYNFMSNYELYQKVNIECYTQINNKRKIKNVSINFKNKI